MINSKLIKEVFKGSRNKEVILTKKFKFVPGKEVNGFLDPTQREMIIKKNSKNIWRQNNIDQLLWQRNRMDKKSFDLTNSQIKEENLLVDTGTGKLIGYLFTPLDFQINSELILFVHGGGFTAGSIRDYRNQCRYLAEQSGHKVLFVEYHLAPEDVYPKQIIDVERTVGFIQTNRQKFKVSHNLILMGDSAGASIINGVVLDLGSDNISLVIELYGVCDLDIVNNHEAYWDYSLYPVVKSDQRLVKSRLDRFKNSTSTMVDYYLNTDKKLIKDAHVSINFASDEEIKKFPRIVLIECEYDFFRICMDIFACKLITNAIPVSIIEYGGCDHGLIDRLGYLKQAEDCLKVCANEIKSL